VLQASLNGCLGSCTNWHKYCFDPGDQQSQAGGKSHENQNNRKSWKRRLGFVNTPMFRTPGNLCRFCTRTRPTKQTDHPHTRLAAQAYVDVRL
jgi:hypothetical protein